MEKEVVLNEISRKGFDKEHFINLANQDEVFREFIVEEMIENQSIMTYYNCFTVISKSCASCPEYYYGYREDFSHLLEHENSYKRDFGLTLWAHLIPVDSEHHFDRIIANYLEHINDEKFMTGECCVKNLAEVLKHRPDLTDSVVEVLLNRRGKSRYSPKQDALMDCYVLEVLEKVYNHSEHQTDINRFILESKDSLSPKTRKKAKEMLKHLG